MLGEHRRAVVVVTRIGRHDARVRLGRERGDYVRQRLVRQPAQAIVIGLARPHPVARAARVAIGTVEGLARVIPCRQQRTSRADRQSGLPLRTSRGVGV